MHSTSINSMDTMEDTNSSPAKQQQQASERTPLDPSRTLSPSSVVESSVHDHNANPFFVVDWFKQLRVADQHDTTTSGSSDKTPEKQKTTVSSSSSLVTPPKFPPNSPFQKQSEAVGAGWNAKGLQKARKDDWQGALECWENALQIRQQVLGPNHKDVSNAHNNLGIALGRLGREEDALVHLNKALEIRTTLYGTKHQDIAATHHNVGNVLQQSGDYTKALESFHQAKRIQQELAPGSVQVARAWNAIGHLHFETQQYQKAGDAYRQALETFRKAGRDDSDMEVEHTKLDLQEAQELLLPC